MHFFQTLYIQFNWFIQLIFDLQAQLNGLAQLTNKWSVKKPNGPIPIQSAKSIGEILCIKNIQDFIFNKLLAWIDLVNLQYLIY